MDQSENPPLESIPGEKADDIDRWRVRCRERMEICCEDITGLASQVANESMRWGGTEEYAIWERPGADDSCEGIDDGVESDFEQKLVVKVGHWEEGGG